MTYNKINLIIGSFVIILLISVGCNSRNNSNKLDTSTFEVVYLAEIKKSLPGEK